LRKEYDEFKLSYEKEKNNLEDTLKECQENLKESAKKFEAFQDVESSKIQIESELRSSFNANGVLKMEIESLEKELQITMEKIPNLELKINEQLENQEIAFEREKSKMQNELIQAEKNLAEKEKEIKNFQIQAEKQVQKLNSEKESSEALRTESVKLRKEYDEFKLSYEKEKNNLEDTLKECQENLKESAKKFEAFQDVESSKIQIESELRSSFNANGVLKMEIESLEKELQITMEKIPNLELKINEQLENQEIAFEREKSKMQNELIHAEKNLAEKEKNRIQAERDRKREVASANVQIELLKKQVQKSSCNDRDNIEALKAKLRNRTNEVEQLQLELEKRKGSSDESQLKDVRKKLDEQRAVYEGYKHTMETKLNEAEKKLDKLREELREKETSYSEDKDIKSMKAEIRNLTMKLELEKQTGLSGEDLDSEVVKLRKERDEIKITYEQEKDDMEAELMACQDIITECSENLEALENVKTSEVLLRAKVEKLERELNIAREKNPDIEKKYHEQLKNQKIAFEKEKAEIQKELKNEKSLLSGHDKDNIDALKAEIRDLKVELEQLQAERQESYASADESLSEDDRKQFEEQKAMYETYKLTMERKLKNAERDVRKFATELELLRKILEGKEASKIEGTKDKVELTELRNKVEALQKEIESLHERLVAKDKQIDRLQNELKSARDELKTFRAAKTADPCGKQSEQEKRILESLLKREVEKLDVFYKQKYSEKEDTTDGDESENKISQADVVRQLREQREVFEQMKSGIEDRLATAEKTIMAKEEEVKIFKGELEALRKEVDEYRSVANGSDGSDYYRRKLKEATKEMEYLRIDAMKYRSILAMD